MGNHPAFLLARTRASAALMLRWSCLCAVLLVASAAPAQDSSGPAAKTKESLSADKGSAKPDEAAEEGPSTFQIPIPVGQTSSGVVVQNLGPGGEYLGTMQAAEATRVNEDEVELGDLKLKLPAETQTLEVNISMEKAVYNVKTAVLRSRSNVHIQRSDFDLYGDAMEYDTLSSVSQLYGNVKMVIHDAEKATGTGSKPKAEDKAVNTPTSVPTPLPSLTIP